MNRDEVLAEFAAFSLEEDGRKVVYLHPLALEQIAMADLPVGVPVGIGVLQESPYQVRKILWNGELVLDAPGSLWSVIRYKLYPGFWVKPLGVNYYFELLHACLMKRTRTTGNLAVDEFDIDDQLTVRLSYRFPVDGRNLEEALHSARRIQADLEAPAQRVLEDVTTALMSSVDGVLGPDHSEVSELVALVESAQSPSHKGAALESLMAALFEQVPGFVVCERDARTETEEIDLVLLNSSSDPVYSKDGPLILVECKNWTAKPGRPDFSLLEGKIRNRHNRCTVAFFVSWSGFTEPTWRETIRTSRENYAIVCLTGEDIRRAAIAGNFQEFLRKATIQTLIT